MESPDSAKRRHPAGTLYSVRIDGTGTPPADVTLAAPPATPYSVLDLNIGTGDMLSLQSGSTLRIVGQPQDTTLTNAGTINLQSGSTFTLPSSGAVTGGGTINVAQGATLQSAGLTPFTIGNQTLVAGALNVTGWTNNGTICNAPGQNLQLTGTNTFFNSGLIDQEGGGTLTITDAVRTPNKGTAGTIQVGPGSTAVLNGGIGGNLVVVGNGVVSGNDYGAGSIVNSSTGSINFTGGDLISYSGTIFNPVGGTISMPGIDLAGGASVDNAGTLQLSSLSVNRLGTANVILRGGGQIVLGGGKNEHLVMSQSRAALINLDQTISGTAIWEAPLFNNGIIDANVNKAAMTFDALTGSESRLPGASVNNGIMMASNGGQMIVNGAFTGSGSWAADGGSLTFQQLANVTTLGSIAVSNAGRLELGAPHQSGVLIVPVAVTASNLTLDASSSMSTKGNITLLGNFSYAMNDPSKWTWSPASGTSPAARLIMDGGVNAVPNSSAGWATLELGEKDNGPNGPGYDTSFSIPTLEIGTGSHVLLTDLLDNGNRGGPAGAPEALYVDQLSFDDPTGQINLDGLHLYYKQLSGSPSQIIDVAVSVPEPRGLAVVVLALAGVMRLRRC